MDFLGGGGAQMQLLDLSAVACFTAYLIIDWDSYAALLADGESVNGGFTECRGNI